MTFHAILDFIQRNKSAKCFGNWNLDCPEHRASIITASINGHLFFATDDCGRISGIGLASSEDNKYFHVNQFIATSKRAKASIINQFFTRWPDAIVSSFHRSGKLHCVRDGKRLLRLFAKL